MRDRRRDVAAAALELPGARGLSLEVAARNLGGARVHPVPGDFTPLTEIADPSPIFRAGLRWTR